MSDPTTAEAIRRRLADAWGDMGAAWGVAPAIARIHAYLMARGEPMTEREVREALGLSHRATSLALAESVAWGLVERVAEPRRVGRRGPAGLAYQAIGDPWVWFGRVIAERKRREADPIVAAVVAASAEADAAAAADPDDPELEALRAWLSGFLGFVRLFDRAVHLVPSVPPSALERGLRVLAGVSDAELLRLAALLEAIPEDDLATLLTAFSHLSPTGASRAVRLVGRTIRAAGG